MFAVANESALMPPARRLHAAVLALRRLDQGSGDAKELAALAETTLRDLEALRVDVERLDLFSTRGNETADDIATGDLRFLLVDAYIGDLVGKRAVGDRKENLLVSRARFESFVNTLDIMGMLPAVQRRPLEAMGLVLPSSLSSASHVPLTAAQKRDSKIERFKHSKELRARLDALGYQLFGRKDEKEAEDYDTDIDREVVVAMLGLMAGMAVDQLESISTELELLEFARKKREGRVEESSSSRTRPPMKPFVLVSKREQIASGVFRPSWRLPTMTIDEYLDLEFQRGNFLQGGTEPPKEKEDDDDEAAVDAKTYKDRAFDEFKDVNPRGSGNRLGRG